MALLYIDEKGEFGILEIKFPWVLSLSNTKKLCAGTLPKLVLLFPRHQAVFQAIGIGVKDFCLPLPENLFFLAW